MARVVFTSEFNKQLRELKNCGKKGKDAVVKSQSALSEANTEGRISSIPRTKHGETRLPNIEKYDLGDGYRLVVQLVNGKENFRAFLFVGTHDAVEHWLDTHKNYKWVKKENDGTLTFIQVTEALPEKGCLSIEPNLISPESHLDLPLLRDLTSDEWLSICLDKCAERYVKGVTANQYECDSEGIIDQILKLSGDNQELASLFIDLFHHAQYMHFDKVHTRIMDYIGKASQTSDEVTAQAMVSPENSETFVTWDDSIDFFNSNPDGDWADWMLFLHDKQKEIATKEFQGPARLRGVSGSGKTCVMLHRARYLAKKYQQRILIVTLTESMRKLLDNLLDMLCGSERSLIFTRTMTGYAKDVLETYNPNPNRSYTIPNEGMKKEMLSQVTNFVRNHELFQNLIFSKMDYNNLSSFIYEEIQYVKSRLLPDDYHKYLNPDFKRVGRGQSLSENARKVFYDALQLWDKYLKNHHCLDYEGIIQESTYLLRDNYGPVHPQLKWRCVLVDEVQDLSQLEVSLLARISGTVDKSVVDCIDGLFLVGDGAQTIYRKGFRLREAGISVANRSFAFLKNYRNTREILESAFGLIKNYEFADVDEDSVKRPLKPEFASRHGEKPLIAKYMTLQEELSSIALQINELINIAEISPAQICIIGLNSNYRDLLQDKLTKLGIDCSILKEDADVRSNHVKISTIESAKGHEFHAVFIPGLMDYIMPRFSEGDSIIEREASRFYVAMTRACDRLILSYNISGARQPSRFLASIQNMCTECEYRNGELRPIL